jgi:hypothetical protein
MMMVEIPQELFMSTILMVRVKLRLILQHLWQIDSLVVVSLVVLVRLLLVAPSPILEEPLTKVKHSSLI